MDKALSKDGGYGLKTLVYPLYLLWVMWGRFWSSCGFPWLCVTIGGQKGQHMCSLVLSYATPWQQGSVVFFLFT